MYIKRPAQARGCEKCYVLSERTENLNHPDTDSSSPPVLRLAIAVTIGQSSSF